MPRRRTCEAELQDASQQLCGGERCCRRFMRDSEQGQAGNVGSANVYYPL